MKSFVYKLSPLTKVVDGVTTTVPNSFEGTVKIKVPKYARRLELLKELNYKFTSSGEVEMNDSALDSAIKMAEIAKEHIEEVDVVFSETGEEFKSFDDLEYCASGVELINECANIVLNGMRMGKN